MKPKRWQDWVNVVLGVWLVASPWALGFSEHDRAAVVAWAAGAAVVLFASLGAYMQEAWEKAITIILGVILMGAPWSFDFADQRSATAAIAFTGVLVVIFAVWAMLRDMDLRNDLTRLKEERRQARGTR
jgi:hypothetical protein